MGDLRDRLDQLGMRRRQPPGPPPTPPPSQPEDLAATLGGAVSTCEDLACWYVATPGSKSMPDINVARADLARPRVYAGGTGDPLAIDPARTLLIDLETAGLAGSPALLIGVMALDEWPLAVHQWLARDFHEERAILIHLRHWIAGRDTWLSFNGRSFDEPLVRERALIHRVELPPATIHLDLLHAARRQWRGELPDCKLKTLETHILGRERVGDVPSGDVPDLFFHFFKTGRARPLAPVLEHNRIDLLSCVELFVNLTKRE